jgi:hypothetical protein
MPASVTTGEVPLFLSELLTRDRLPPYGRENDENRETPAPVVADSSKPRLNDASHVRKREP